MRRKRRNTGRNLRYVMILIWDTTLTSTQEEKRRQELKREKERKEAKEREERLEVRCGLPHLT